MNIINSIPSMGLHGDATATFLYLVPELGIRIPRNLSAHKLLVLVKKVTQPITVLGGLATVWFPTKSIHVRHVDELPCLQTLSIASHVCKLSIRNTSSAMHLQQ